MPLNKIVFICSLIVLGAAASPGPTLLAQAEAGRSLSLQSVLAVGFDPARKSEFASFVNWSEHPSDSERAGWQGACGFADHRSLARAMVRAVQLSSSKDEAVRLWNEAEAVAIAGASRSSNAASSISLNRPTPLGRELARRAAVDQVWRSVAFEKAHTPAEQEVIAWRSRAATCHVDDENTQFMKKLVARSGWPTISEHGEAAAGDAWLLTQHADADRAYQRQALSLMAPLVAKREVSGKQYATLFDRIAVADKQPQRYGSQFTEGEGGCLQPSPVENMANVDSLRQSVGLSSIREYATGLSDSYKKSICKTWLRTQAGFAKQDN